MKLFHLANVPPDIEIMCVEINLRKQKWMIIGLYRPPKMNEISFLNHLSRIVDLYSKRYDRIIIMGDFISEPNNEHIGTFNSGYSLYNLVKGKTCFKGTSKCYDLIFTNCKHNFQNTAAMTTGFSDFHKMVVTVLKTRSYQLPKRTETDRNGPKRTETGRNGPKPTETDRNGPKRTETDPFQTTVTVLMGPTVFIFQLRRPQ